jgi:N-glycosylase/DNA lyase
MAPVDTWISKIIDSQYQGVNPFPAYGDAAGIMQQYAFYNAQIHKKERNNE